MSNMFNMCSQSHKGDWTRQNVPFFRICLHSQGLKLYGPHTNTNTSAHTSTDKEVKYRDSAV